MTSPHYLDTGQRTCHADNGREIPCAGSGQDASFAVGMPWPEPRFELHGDEVMDCLTGLVWCRNANLAEFPLAPVRACATTPPAKSLHAPAPVRTANFATARRGLNPASKSFPAAYWIASPACSGAMARTSRRNRRSGARHWPLWPCLTWRKLKIPGDCQPSTNWKRWWIAPPTARPCRQGILSPMYRKFTGHPPPAGSSPIGLGPCT